MKMQVGKDEAMGSNPAGQQNDPFLPPSKYIYF